MTKVRVGIAKCSSVEDSLKKAVELAGDLDFINQNQSVLLKPNANTADEHPGSTSPEFLKRSIRLIKQKTNRIIVGEKSMASLNTISVLKETGMYDAAINEGVEVLSFDDVEWKMINHKKLTAWPQGYSVPKILDEIDHYVHLCIAKTHWTATFTMALKGVIGLTKNEDRMQLPHGRHNNDELFGAMIAESNLARKPDFILMDATKIFVSGGPNSGALKEPGIVISTKDPIANDIVGLALLKSIGTVPKIQDKSVWRQPQIRRAIELNLGVKSPKEMDLRFYGVDLEDKIREHVDDLILK